MPVSLATARDPFRGRDVTPQPKSALRVPQARVLRVLMPAPGADLIDWPLVTRAQLGLRAGYTGTSGSVTRAMNGIREGSSSGDAHPGLLERGLVEVEVLDIEDVAEDNYRITPRGIEELCAWEAAGNRLPTVKDRAKATNKRYRSEHHPAFPPG